MPCKKCGNLLLIGMKGQTITFCPKCEGLSIIEKKKTLKMLGKSISEKKSECIRLIQELDRDALLILLISLREKYLLRAKSHEFDFRYFMAYTRAIADIQYYGVQNKEKFDLDDDRISKILFEYIEKIEIEKSFHLVLKGFMVFITIPKDKIAYDYLGDQTLYSTPDFIGKLTEYWSPFYENLSFLGMKTDEEIEDLYLQGEYPSTGKLIKESNLFDRVQLICCIELATANSRDFLNQLNEYNFLNYDGYRFIQNSAIYAYTKIFKNETQFFDKNGLLITIRKRNFIREALQWGFSRENMQELYKDFVSSFDNPKSVPLIIEHKGRLYIPAQTLTLMYLIFKIIISQGTTEDMRSEFGYFFEEIVEFKLQEMCFSLSPPNKPEEYYKNYRDDLYNPAFEIDFIAHKNDVIYVIECKSWLPRLQFLSKELIKDRIKQIVSEEEKQQKRVSFVTNNLEELGFNSLNIKKIVSIILTLLDEPCTKINETHIFRLSELDNFETPK